MKKLFPFFTLTLAVLFVSCDPSDDDTSSDATRNIVETAAITADLSNLVGALVLADENPDSNLIATLNAPGPYTVFAPSNQAFADLLGQLDGIDTLDDFDTVEERTLLAKVVQYHVVTGVAALSTGLSNGSSIPTFQGEEVSISTASGVQITDKTGVPANVTTADIITTNGVVHIIDKVLIPQEVLDLLNGGN